MEHEYPKPASDEVTVKVKTCGICGTDLHFYNEFPGGRPIPLGHEVSGYVYEIGKDVTEVKPGGSVIVQNHLPCGRCRSCLQGKTSTCSSIQTYMNDRSALAEYLTVKQNMVVPFSGLNYTGAVVAEPLTVAFDITREAQVQPFQRVVVSGSGIIGLFCTVLLKMGGAEPVVVLGRMLSSARGEKRAEAAVATGASQVFDTEEQDRIERVQEQYPEGFERIIVTSPPV